VASKVVHVAFLGLMLCSCGKVPDQPQLAQNPKLPVRMDSMVTEYDRFKDETRVSSAASNVTDHLLLWFSYYCKGQSTACDPGFVMADFRISPDPAHQISYADLHELIFLADGLRIHAAFDLRGEEWNSLGNGLEQVLAGFTPNDFSKLVRARSVEGRLGETEFTVQESDLEKWRLFAAGIRIKKN
jgi:hypothetical protein